MTWILAIVGWAGVVGGFVIGYCAGAAIGYRKGFESANRIEQDDAPLFERY